MSDLTQDTDWYSPEVATFGDRVAAAREAAGMDQVQLAKRLGVRHSTLRGWEDDVSEPRANRLSMLAGLLNVSMMWLINGEGEGLDGPDQTPLASSDASGLLSDMRVLREEMTDNAKKMGRLEKRLRLLLKEINDA